MKQSAGLSFVYRDSVISPAGVVVPGMPDESELLTRVTHPDPELRMPPPGHGPPLSAQEVDVLRQWVQQGAAWEDTWALAAPITPALPGVRDGGWPRTGIDRFVLARLEAEGLHPSPDEAPERWLRRASLDLTGLPPSTEEADAFLADLAERGELAYDTAVDRLLASPHFGERWASVWLDQVRYADSQGLGFDYRREAWKYRDWVVDALNRDVPYDRFTLQQIAGDLLPDPTMEDLIATACHRMTQSNDEGGTDDEEFRVEAVLDRVNTTWQAWLGTTFGCARCHDHPYEPFRHEEYYQFAAFFNNTRDSDLAEEWPVRQIPYGAADYARAKELDDRIDALQDALWRHEFELASNADWRPLTELTAASDSATQVEVEWADDHAEFHTLGTRANDTDITLTGRLPEGVASVSAIRLHCLPQDPDRALSASEWGFVLSHVSASLMSDGEQRRLDLAYVIGDEPNPFLDPQLSLNDRSPDGFSAYSRINHPRSAVVVLKSPVEMRPGDRLRVELSHRKELLSSFALITQRGYIEVTSSAALTGLLGDERRQQDLDELVRLRRDRRRIRSTPLPVMEERPERFERPTHVLVRGDFTAKGEPVSASVPGALPPLPAGAPPNRLGVAQWLVDPANPLTARVAVNRLWARMFGTGLVLTEEDFGATGDPPTHPELLDYLAARYQGELKWSTKALLREIALSSTYRQTGVARRDLGDRDPHNRLLARGPRTSLSAEMIRDQALAASGLLTRELGGPPTFPPIPEGVWDPFDERDRWRTPPPGDPQRYRRSLYTYWKRSIPYPLATAFDAPSREVCAPRRVRSSTPMQALMTLNGEDFQEIAAALADRMQEADESPEGQIIHGFRRVVSRRPRASEVAALAEFYDQLPADKTPQQRLQLIAGVLLNLDEALTK